MQSMHVCQEECDGNQGKGQQVARALDNAKEAINTGKWKNGKPKAGDPRNKDNQVRTLGNAVKARPA